MLPDHIQIIDSGQAVARQTQKVIQEKVGVSNLKNPEPIFYSNTNTAVLNAILKNKYILSRVIFNY